MRRSTPLILCLALAGLAACAETGTEPEGIPNPVDIGLIASHVSLTLNVGLDHFSVARRGLEAGTAPDDTLLAGVLDCPAAVAGGTGSVSVLHLDYTRAGCAATTHGLETTGSVRYAVRRPAGKLFLEDSEFADFARAGASLDGLVSTEATLLAPGDQVSLRAQAVTLFTPGGAGILSGSFFAVRQATQENPATPLCFLWLVNEGTAAVETGNRAYTVAVQTPLQTAGCCGTVVAGRIGITVPGFLRAVVDYGDGACDRQATMQSGTEVIMLTLAGS